MKNKISVKQAKYAAGAFLLASTLMVREIYLYLEQEAVVAVLLAYVLCRFSIWICGSLARRFPGKSLQELNDAVFGKLLGSAISVLYLFFFFSLIILNTRDLGEFVRGMVLPKTPIAVTMALFLLLCAWAVRNGMKHVTRSGFLLVLVPLCAITINGLLLLKNMSYEHFLPMFDNPVYEYLIAAHFVAALPLGEVVVLYSLVPHMEHPEQLGKALKGGLNLAFVIFLLIVLRDVAVLGEYIKISSLPSFSVLRLIDIANILTRLEMVYAVLLISQLFYKVSLLFGTFLEHLGRLLRLPSPQFLIHILAVMALVFSLAVYDSAADHTEWLNQTAAIYSSIFLTVLPGFTLLLAAVRRLPTVGRKPPQLGQKQGMQQEGGA